MITLTRNRGGTVASAVLTVVLVAALAGIPAGAAQAEDVIVGANAPGAIAGSYIVTLRQNTDVPDHAAALAARYGGDLRHVYTSVLSGFAISLPEQAARAMAANPAVARVEADAMAHAVQTASWGLDRIDQRQLPLDDTYSPPNNADSVTVYSLDTGVRISHEDFGGRATNGYDFIDDDPTANDCAGHGTHTSGTMVGDDFGAANGAELVAVRVLDCEGNGPYSTIIAGVDWVTNNAQHPAVANMSLGGPFSQSLNDAVANSISSGVVYTISAGNSNSDACNSSPASLPQAITVGATKINDERSDESDWGTGLGSNFGTCLDLFAPGDGITSAWTASDTATNTINGTSMAAPHVGGAAALILQANPSWSPQQVRDAIVNNATTNVVNNPGSGSPNRLLYVAGADQPPPPDAGTDPNGVEQIYATTPDTSKAEPWTLGFGAWESRFDIDGGSSQGAGADTVITNDGQVRMDVVSNTASADCDGNEDFAENLQRGWSCAPDDWYNIELTGYVRLVDAAGDGRDQDWTWYGPSGRHTNDGQYPDKCWGNAYKGSYHYSNAEVRFGKETWHVNYDYGGPAPGWVEVPGGIDYTQNSDEWLGMKYIRYEFTRNGERGIRLELWLDLSGIDSSGDPANNWQKVLVVEDHPDGESWGSGATDCDVPTDDQILLWGNPKAVFRWDNTQSQLRLASVREIVPPGGGGGDPTPPPEGSCGPLMTPVSASDNGNDGNGPDNVLDNDLGTRWSHENFPAVLTTDLGSTKNLCGAAVAWHKGNERTNDFTLSTSTDGSNWTERFSGTSSGNSLALEHYAFSSSVQARYLRLTVTGNSDNNWASVTEVRGEGSDGGDGDPPPPGSGQDPVAQISYSCQSVVFLFDCTFDGSASHDPDGTIQSWDWGFGDGSTSSGETVPHLYSEGGTYTVTLTVTDNDGRTNTITQPVNL